MPSLTTIVWLGVKELRSLRSDVVLIALVAYAFTVAIYTQARGTSSEVNNASIAFVDEDQSQLSQHFASCFYPPRFKPPGTLRAGEVDRAMNEGRYMFVVVIPPRFEADLRAGRRTEVQVNIDATAMYQASNGASYIQSILNDEMSRYLVRSDAKLQGPMRLVIRKAFNMSSNAWLELQWVQRDRRHHQPDHAADGDPDRGRPDSRAGARHPRAPDGDATDRV